MLLTVIYLNDGNQNRSENFSCDFFRRELHPESLPLQCLRGQTLNVERV
jgi:hypothetical protein